MSRNCLDHWSWDRSTFLIASPVGLGHSKPVFSSEPGRRIATSTIPIWLEGGFVYRHLGYKTSVTGRNKRRIYTNCDFHARHSIRQPFVSFGKTDASSGSYSIGDTDRWSEMQGPNNHASGCCHGMTTHPPDASLGLRESRHANPDHHPFIGSVVAYKYKLYSSLPQLEMLP